MYKLVTAPTSEPIVTADARLHLRLLHNDHNDLIDSIVTAARQQFENDVPNIQLMPATWKLLLDEWPKWKKHYSAHILLKKEPIIAISTIEYYPEGETNLTELDTGSYKADTDSFPGRVELLETPALNTNLYNCVQITFTCGYANAGLVPGDIKQALKLLIGHYYNNPEQIVTGTQVNELPIGYRQICVNHIREWV